MKILLFIILFFCFSFKAFSQYDPTLEDWHQHIDISYKYDTTEFFILESKYKLWGTSHHFSAFGPIHSKVKQRLIDRKTNKLVRKGKMKSRQKGCVSRSWSYKLLELLPDKKGYRIRRKFFFIKYTIKEYNNYNKIIYKE